jgi:hypothetical protein
MIFRQNAGGVIGFMKLGGPMCKDPKSRLIDIKTELTETALCTKCWWLEMKIEGIYESYQQI